MSCFKWKIYRPNSRSHFLMNRQAQKSIFLQAYLMIFVWLAEARGWKHSWWLRGWRQAGSRASSQFQSLCSCQSRLSILCSWRCDTGTTFVHGALAILQSNMIEALWANESELSPQHMSEWKLFFNIWNYGWWGLMHHNLACLRLITSPRATFCWHCCWS